MQKSYELNLSIKVINHFLKLAGIVEDLAHVDTANEQTVYI